jgi:Domain of unknown function (DUF1707)/Cell wall-active antibiotics response 4TMS YvqF
VSGEPVEPQETRPVHQPSIAPDIRASDSERELIVTRLSEHAAAGRLTLSELEERIGLAYASTTRAELSNLIADLPKGVAVPAPTRRKPTRWLLALMSGTEKKGRWRVGRQLTAVAVMGGTDIDLRHAEIDADEVTIVAIALMGGIDVYVPDSVDLEIGGFAFMGGTAEKGSSRAPRPGGPRIRILAYPVMGGIDIWRLPEEAKGLPLSQARRLAKAAH